MSNSPPSSDQPDNTNPTDPFIEYSRALYEYTLDLWWQTIKVAEERGQNPLEPFRLHEYYASQSRQQQQPQQSSTPLTGRESVQEQSHSAPPSSSKTRDGAE